MSQTQDDYYMSPQQQAPQPQMPMQQPQAPAQQQPQQQPIVVQVQKDSGSKSQYVDDFLDKFDLKEILKRALKYLVVGVAVGGVAYFLSQGALDAMKIIMIGLTAAIVLAIFDIISPTIALGIRFGAGFGIGQALIGMPAAMAAGPVMAVA